ncbi:MAG: hypothetical protein [Bacteriophage sp.]|jgi:hypothetical protein|nr:MAG: hypothetical protein [Bacteriophage sp.]UVX42511.1 MAG: hypothetical protein [Bacteriophage sp.]
MRIEEILKELQPYEYDNLDKKRKKAIQVKRKTSRKEKLDIKELMSNRYYRRGRGGAIKQVR